MTMPEIRERFALLAHHVVEIVRERVLAGRRIVAIRRQVQHDPKFRHRREAAGGALCQEMRQRQRVGRHVIGGAIPGGIEMP